MYNQENKYLLPARVGKRLLIMQYHKSLTAWEQKMKAISFICQTQPINRDKMAEICVCNNTIGLRYIGTVLSVLV